jgi:hypothetical protein
MINAHAIEAFYEHRNRRIEAPVVERRRLAARLKDEMNALLQSADHARGGQRARDQDRPRLRSGR